MTEPQSFRDIVGEISGKMDALLKSGINKKAVIILLCHGTKLPQRDVRKVLEELALLQKNFTSTPGKKPASE